jgi:hypothetical protein
MTFPLFIFLYLTRMLWGMGTVNAQSGHQAVESLIQDSFDTLWSAYKTDQILNYHTSGYMLLENGIVWNNDSVAYYLQRAASSGQDYQRINRFEFEKIPVNGKQAWCAYINYATLKSGEKVLRKISWLESANLVKKPESWRIQFLHATRRPEEQ